jgi:DNA-binding NtrC family response regulator
MGEACIILTTTGIGVDVVLCDIHCPGRIDGFGLAQWIRQQVPQFDVMLAGGVDRVAKQVGDLCEAGPHLVRPYHHQTLSDAIKQRLARRERQRVP